VRRKESIRARIDSRARAACAHQGHLRNRRCLCAGRRATCCRPAGHPAVPRRNAARG
jgi:hypothetical protein